MYQLSAGRLVFHPTVETVVGVIPDVPLRLLLNGAGSDIAAIRGVNKDEDSLFYLSEFRVSCSLTKVRHVALFPVA